VLVPLENGHALEFSSAAFDAADTVAYALA
jgi:hypothetical protein